jgi:hypothetical protein
MTEGSKRFGGLNGLSGIRVRGAVATQHRDFLLLNPRKNPPNPENPSNRVQPSVIDV